MRAVAPGRKAYRRGSVRRLLRHTSSTGALHKAMVGYEHGKLAPGSRQSQADRIAFWTRRAAAHGVEPFPLDTAKLKLLGALLLAGAYRSASGYFSANKMEHIRRGGDWTVQLAKEVTDGTRSCTRGH